jgi:hypothetical protein
MSRQYQPVDAGVQADAEDLRGLFSALRREVDLAPPEFSAVLRRAGVREAAGRRHRWLAVTACALLLLAPLLWLVPGRHKHDPGGVSLSEWRSPTDFLLQTPGQELLRDIPEIGQRSGELRVRAYSRRSGGKGRQ